MIIEKKPCELQQYYNEIKYFFSAREGFKSILDVYSENGEYTIFLPAYIGWSPNEGSGIYDPVCEKKIPHIFYPFNERLEIDVEALVKLVRSTEGRKVLLLVHYFGFVDLNYEKILDLMKKEGVFVIEDGAHALYTHLVDRKCGDGDCMLYSFHKMLPYEDGGAIRTNAINSHWWSRISSQTKEYPYYCYDLAEIAEKRKENAQFWEEKLQDDDRVILLRNLSEYKNQTPQTYPILLKNSDRYQVYLKLNELGYGVISLYHTMIKPIIELDNPKVNRISGCILNLPVHQDIAKNDLEKMYKILIENL